MERKNYIIVVLLLFNLTVFAASGYKQQIYNTYIAGDMKRWKQLLDEIYPQVEKQPNQIIEFINYQYGYAGWCVGTGKKEEAKIWISRMEQHIAMLEKRNYKQALVQAYKAAIIGFKVGLDKYKAPFIGPKSIEYAKTAMQLDEKEPMGFLQYGNILFFTPEIFGGSKQKAIGYYLSALEKMEAEPSQTIGNWNYLSLLTAIATAYYETGEQQKALSVLEKCLQIEPGFKWVKNELYPKYKNKK